MNDLLTAFEVLLAVYKAYPISKALRQSSTVFCVPTCLDNIQAERPFATRRRQDAYFDRLSKLGGEAIVEALRLIEDGSAVFTPQDGRTPYSWRRILRLPSLVQRISRRHTA